MKKGDKIIFISILIIFIISSVYTFFYFNYNNDGNIATVKKDGKIIETIDLSKVLNKEYIIEDNNVKAIIQVNNGKIRFKYSNCENKLCEKSGYIYIKGQFVVCLPNKIMIEIIKKEDDIDDLSY